MNTGIYQIRNVINNKIYIGQTVSFSKRKIRHFWELKNNRHHNSFVQRAFNKYGVENFKFEILITCLKEELTVLEQYLVDFYQPAYNLCKDVVGSCRGVKRSDETKNKMSVSHIGKKLSDEHKEKIRISHIGLKQSPETIRKRVLKLTGKKLSFEKCLLKSLNSTCVKAVYQICPNTNQIINEFKSLALAGKSVGISGNAIGNHLKGRSLTSGGYKWNFKNNKLWA